MITMYNQIHLECQTKTWKFKTKKRYWKFNSKCLHWNKLRRLWMKIKNNGTPSENFQSKWIPKNSGANTSHIEGMTTLRHRITLRSPRYTSFSKFIWKTISKRERAFQLKIKQAACNCNLEPCEIQPLYLRCFFNCEDLQHFH